jgi:hypothetical protein
LKFIDMEVCDVLMSTQKVAHEWTFGDKSCIKKFEGLTSNLGDYMFENKS